MGTRLLHVVVKKPSTECKFRFQSAKRWRFKHNPSYDVSTTRLLSNIGTSTEWPYYKIVAFDALNKGKNTRGKNGTNNPNTNAW